MSEDKSNKPQGPVKLGPLPNPIVVPKWPFLICDALFIGLAVWLSLQVKPPIEPWQAGCIFAAVVLGACFATAPFYWEYRAEAKVVEIALLSSVTKEVNKMEDVAKQIAECTGNWTHAQKASDQSIVAAKEIAQQISEDAKSFSLSMSELNDSKLKSLELELVKLKRAEQDWGSIVIGHLDLIYRLRESAVLSGKKQFIETMTTFQSQCRDIARRVGLIAFDAEVGAAFDTEQHQLGDVDAKPGKNGTVASTIRPGYKLQGHLVRKVVVSLKG